VNDDKDIPITPASCRLFSFTCSDPPSASRGLLSDLEIAALISTNFKPIKAKSSENKRAELEHLFF
jgi:hypothetical protein